MQIQVEATNATDQKVPLEFSEDFLGKISHKLEKEAGLKLPQKIIVDIAFVDEKRIRQLNNEYREKDETTDVLSFCYEKKHDTIIGEILLCLPVIEKNAKADEIETEDELKKNIVHGLLHILGFDHGKKMFAIQDKLTQA